MTTAYEPRVEPLRFAVIGDSHSGHGVVRAALNSHPEAACHGDLLHEDLPVRSKERAYAAFGADSAFLDFDPSGISAEQYLNWVYRKIDRNEAAVGVQLPYSQVRSFDLWHYLDVQVRAGNFCVVHVVRNPVSCCIRTRRTRQSGSRDRYRNHALYIEADELIRDVRTHIAVRRKIDNICAHRVVVTYAELRKQPRLISDYVCPYLGLRGSGSCHVWPRKPGPPVSRLVANWAQLLREVDGETRTFMEQAVCETTVS